VEEVLNISSTLKLDVIGFSFHVGSGCSSPDCFYEAIRSCKEAVDIATKLGIVISMIDIGGGFPGNNPAQFEQMTLKIKLAMHDFFKERLAEKTIQFIAEPGRYFVEKSHTLVLNIIGKKKIKDKEEQRMIYYLNDGVYNSFNCILYDYRVPIILPFNERDGVLHKSKLFGPTCDSIDLIAEHIMLPELAIGEWVYVENFGAYTVAASSEFNGIKKPINKYIFCS
jgi:ornithine decarboxylase